MAEEDAAQTVEEMAANLASYKEQLEQVRGRDRRDAPHPLNQP